MQVFIFIFIWDLQKVVAAASYGGVFTLFSPSVTTSLSNTYNCNSNTTGVNPPFNWTNTPSGTKAFAFLMGSYQLSASGESVASGFDWGLYNLSSTTTSVSQNCSNPYHNTCGRAGAAWNNGHPDEVGDYYYWPPCSSDCKIKNYTFTVYALASPISNPYHTLSNYNLSVIVQKKGMTLASASMIVSSLRTKGCQQNPSTSSPVPSPVPASSSSSSSFSFSPAVLSGIIIGSVVSAATVLYLLHFYRRRRCSSSSSSGVQDTQNLFEIGTVKSETS